LASSQKTAVGVHIAQFQPPSPVRRSAAPRDLRGGFIGPDHDRFAVGRPECAIEIPVEGSSDIAAVAFHPIHDEDILIVALHAVARIEIGDVFTVGEATGNDANFVCVVMASDFAVARSRTCGEEFECDLQNTYSPLAHRSVCFHPQRR